MKTKIILFLLCLASLSVMGQIDKTQGTIRREKCSICGKVVSQCQYKGKHPKPQPEKVCTTCGKVLSKCQYKGKHPEKTCSTCGKVVSQCQYKGNHPAPEPSGYDVSFTCNVPDAALVIDGRNYGNPTGTIYMKSGEHSVTLTAEGYKVYNQKITVDKNNNSFNFVMEEYQELQTASPVDIAMVPEDAVEAQNDEEGSFTLNEIKSLHSEKISAIINGKRYFYSVCTNNPNHVVIVEQKGAYKELQEVILPETFKSDDGKILTIVGIGDKAFYKCKKIRKVVLPGTVRFIGKWAFAFCGVTEVSFNKGLISIGDDAFWDNDILDIYLPEGVEEVGAFTFFGNKPSLFSRAQKGNLYIPKTVTKIGVHAFAMSVSGIQWINSKRKITCLPDFINLDNCKKCGISKDSVEEYFSK